VGHFSRGSRQPLGVSPANYQGSLGGLWRDDLDDWRCRRSAVEIRIVRGNCGPSGLALPVSAFLAIKILLTLGTKAFPVTPESQYHSADFSVHMQEEQGVTCLKS
jgi:hypothetical protein